MRTEIIRLHNELQTTFVYVTHDQTEAMTMGTRIVVMKDGYIQQVDTPDNLYDYPVNKFVAGFIGTPQMNFVDVIMEQDGKKVSAVFGRNRIEIAKETVARITAEEVNKRQFVIGIRSEDVRLCDESEDTSKNKAIANGVVKITEKLGNETLVYCTLEGLPDSEFVVRGGARCRVNIGDPVKIAFDTIHMQLFDYDTELNLLKR